MYKYSFHVFVKKGIRFGDNDALLDMGENEGYLCSEVLKVFYRNIGVVLWNKVCCDGWLQVLVRPIKIAVVYFIDCFTFCVNWILIFVLMFCYKCYISFNWVKIQWKSVLCKYFEVTKENQKQKMICMIFVDNSLFFR